MNNNNWRKPSQEIRNEKLAAKKVQKSFAKSVGTGTFEGLGAVDRPHCIQIKRIDNNCESLKIQEFLKDTLKLKFSDFKAFELPHEHFKAYTLTISFLDKKIVKEKHKWPQGWVVNSFYQPNVQTKTSQTNQNSGAFNFGSINTNTARNGSNIIPS